MTYRTVLFADLMIDAQQPGDITEVVVTPAVALHDLDTVAWPFPSGVSTTIVLTNGEGNLDLETTYLGDSLPWNFKVFYKNTAGDVIAKESFVKTIPQGDSHTVDTIDFKNLETYVSGLPNHVLNFSYDPRFSIYSNLAANPELLTFSNIQRDNNLAITIADVTWPDGAEGVYSSITTSTSWPSEVDSYEITYHSWPMTTFTQPAVTRDPATGDVVYKPKVIIS